VEPCVKAGCPEMGTVLDPFGGSGTVGKVANRLSRRAVLIELNPDYVEQIEERTMQAPLGLTA
jgi:DNA modification methylase